MRVSRGLVIFSTSGQEASKLPALGDVKERVREDALRAKAREMSQTRAAALGDGVQGELRRRRQGGRARAQDHGAGGARHGVARRGHQRGGGRGGLRAARGRRHRARSRPTPAPSWRASSPAKRPSADALATAKETLRQELLADRKSKFYTAYMNKARERLKVTVNPDAVKAVVG